MTKPMKMGEALDSPDLKQVKDIINDVIKKPILTPTQQFNEDLKKKQIEVAKQVKDLLDKEGFEMQVAQTIIVVPKRDYGKK